MKITTNFFLYEKQIKKFKLYTREGKIIEIERKDIRCPKCGSKWIYVLVGSIHLYTKCKSCGAFEDLGLIAEAYT